MKNLFLTFFLLTCGLIHSQWKYERIEIDYEKKKVAYASSAKLGTLYIEQYPVFIFFYDGNTIMIGIEGYYNSPRFAFNFTSKDGTTQKYTSKSGVLESFPKEDFKNFIKITGNGYNFYKVKGNIQSLIPDLKKFHSVKLEITSEYNYSRNISLSGSSAAINYVLGIKSSIQTKNIRSRTSLYKYKGRQYTFYQVKDAATTANLSFEAYISKHGIKEIKKIKLTESQRQSIDQIVFKLERKGVKKEQIQNIVDVQKEMMIGGFNGSNRFASAEKIKFNTFPILDDSSKYAIPFKALPSFLADYYFKVFLVGEINNTWPSDIQNILLKQKSAQRRNEIIQQNSNATIKSKKSNSLKTKSLETNDSMLLWVIILFSLIIIVLLVLLIKKNVSPFKKDILKKTSSNTDSNSKTDNLLKIESNNKSLIDKDQLSYCINCGGKLDQSNAFCVKCGNKVEKI